MSKQAFLVGFSPRTRVVVDVTNANLSELEDFDKVIAAARERMIDKGIESYLNGDTVDDIILDEEQPYPQGYDE